MDMLQAKTALRGAMKARRAEIVSARRQEASLALAAIGLDFAGPPLPGATIGGFMPIGEEISPLPLMLQLHKQGFRLALPVMMGKGKALEFRSYVPGDPLIADHHEKWGIRAKEHVGLLR